jgi:tRNA nucleotidyltransferase (CCA-adding enzyme)
MAPRDLAELKSMFVRPGFVEEWNNLDNAAREFNKLLTAKEAATPSATWKLFTSADPQAVLWLGLTSKSPAVQTKYRNFFTVWPEARQKIPHALLQELRITPEAPGYEEMIGRLFLGVIDGDLETEEQLRAFLEPYSPPAPPPPVTVRRTRGSRKGGDKNKVAVEVAFDGEALELDDEEPGEDVADEGEEDDDSAISLPPVAKKSVPLAKKSEPESEESLNGKPAPEMAKAVPVAAKTLEAPSLHVVTPSKPAKVHVMAKPGKAVSPNRAAGHSTGTAKKALPMKAAHAKPIAGKPVASKMVRRPAVKPAVKAVAKNGAQVKKAAPKAAAKVHKKLEPLKKSHPVKKPAAARKHR